MKLQGQQEWSMRDTCLFQPLSEKRKPSQHHVNESTFRLAKRKSVSRFPTALPSSSDEACFANFHKDNIKHQLFPIVVSELPKSSLESSDCDLRKSKLRKPPENPLPKSSTFLQTFEVLPKLEALKNDIVLSVFLSPITFRPCPSTTFSICLT